jgi:small-conductance mechanosensitive channel
MKSEISFELLVKSFDGIKAFFLKHVINISVLIQLFFVLITFALCMLIGKKTQKFFKRKFSVYFARRVYLDSIFNAVVDLIPYIYNLIVVWLGLFVASQLKLGQVFILNTISTLLLAWLIIKLSTSIIIDQFLAKLITVLAWTIAALSILGLYDAVIKFMEGINIKLAAVDVTLLLLFKSVLTLIGLLYLSKWLSNYVNNKLKDVSWLSPSSHVLLGKGIKTILTIIAFLIVLKGIGINLGALTVFSGVFGVVVGFGLQKIISNVLSGITLLVDQSIKPGDVIEVGGYFGWVTSMKTRYVSVQTPDGKEHLIPNEDLMTNEVVNWTFSNNKVRLNVPIGISYKCDPHLAIKLTEEAVKKIERILPYPEPKCIISGFGDSAIDLTLYFWIADPQNGLEPIKGQVYINVWDIFKKHGIKIPFPQRDVHIDPVVVKTSMDKILGKNLKENVKEEEVEKRKLNASEKVALLKKMNKANMADKTKKKVKKIIRRSRDVNQV